MTGDELKKELVKLREAGLDPMLCDAKVPLVDVPVLAGVPTLAGDVTQGDYVNFPRALIGNNSVFLIDVDGLSMLDLDILPGDRLEVQMFTSVADGDVVVAEVDGGYTVKTLFTDSEGLMWLVPMNKEYDAILLTGTSWRVVGKVIGLRRGMPRASFSDCANAVMRTRRKNAKADEMDAHVDDDQPRNLIFKQFHKRRRIDFAAVRKAIERVVVMQLKHRYEWYAAYRILHDLELLDELQLSKFAQQMRVWFPDVALCCTSDSLGEYAVGHTSKAFTLWNRDVFLQDMRKGQSLIGFTTLVHRCEELSAQLFPVPTIELGLPF